MCLIIWRHPIFVRLWHPVSGAEHDCREPKVQIRTFEGVIPMMAGVPGSSGERSAQTAESNLPFYRLRDGRWPTLGRNHAKFGRARPEICRSRPHISRVGDKFGRFLELGRCRSSLWHSWSSVAQGRPTSTAFNQIWATFGPDPAKLADVLRDHHTWGHICTELHRL